MLKADVAGSCSRAAGLSRFCSSEGDQVCLAPAALSYNLGLSDGLWKLFVKWGARP